MSISVYTVQMNLLRVIDEGILVVLFDHFSHTIGNRNDFAVIVTPQKKSDQVIGISRNIDLATNMFLFVPNITQ
jgi:hypothetical protein